jgi:hypothetical protein
MTTVDTDYHTLALLWQQDVLPDGEGGQQPSHGHLAWAGSRVPGQSRVTVTQFPEPRSLSCAIRHESHITLTFGSQMAKWRNIHVWVCLQKLIGVGLDELGPRLQLLDQGNHCQACACSRSCG